MSSQKRRDTREPRLLLADRTGFADLLGDLAAENDPWRAVAAAAAAVGCAMIHLH